jgi:uncharacterized membrane-anchored protein
MLTLPKINASYWVALCAASVFGTNTGDYLAEEMHFGHLESLPILLIMLAVIFAAARAIPQAAIFLFWAAIITVRTAATNVGDAFHGYHIGFSISIPVISILFILAVAAYRAACQAEREAGSPPPFNRLYWVCIMMAGIWGTLVGDFASFAVHLGTLGATAVLSAVVAAMLFGFKQDKLGQPFIYWSVIAMIRAAGTALGDFLAHGMGLGPSTLATGLGFAALIAVFYGFQKGDVIARRGVA